MDVPEVDALPILDSTEFPSLADISPEMVVGCSNTRLRSADLEFAAGCLIAACIKVQRWRPITSKEFFNVFQAHRHEYPLKSVNVRPALWTLVQRGFVEAVSYNGSVHFAPTAKLAHIVLHASCALT